MAMTTRIYSYEFVCILVGAVVRTPELLAWISRIFDRYLCADYRGR